MPSAKPWTAALVVVGMALAPAVAGAQAPSGFLESLDVRLVNLEAPEEGLEVVPVLLFVPLGFLDELPAAMRKVPAALYIATRDQEGRTAPVQQLEVELDRASEGGRQTTGFRLLMRPGPQRLAVGLVVPSAGASAFVSGELEVGG